MLTSERSLPRSRPLFIAAAAVALGLPTLNLLWVRFTWGGIGPTTAADNLFEIVAAFAAAAACAFAALRQRGRPRWGWALLGAGCLSWGMGAVIFGWIQVVERANVPFPSYADAGYLGEVPLAIVGIVYLTSTPLRRTTRTRTVLDGLIIAGSLLFVSWATALGTAYSTASGPLAEKAVGLAYPVSDILMGSLILLLLPRAPRLARRSLYLVGLGVLANTVADSAFTYLQLDNSYGTNNLIDAGWVLGFLLIGLGALRHGWLPVPESSEEDLHISRTAALLPYVAVGVCGPLTMYQELRTGMLQPFLFWNGIVIVGLLVWRQLLTLLANLDARTADLKRSEQRFRSLVQNSSDAIVIIDAQNRISYHSPSLERLFGYAAQQVDGHSILEAIHPDDRPAVEALIASLSSRPEGGAVVETRVRHRDGRLRTCEFTITNLLSEPSVRGLVVNSRDITDRKALEEQLARQAFSDSLTGIPNRALFKDRLQQTLARAARRQERPAVLFFDLDRFKDVNDSLGHTVGDELLAAVAQRLQTGVRKGDTMARMGGDEFAVLMEDTDEPGAAVQVAQRIIDALRRPFNVSAHEVSIRASIGIAPMITGQEDAGELLRNADIAMYMAKAEGKGGFQFFSPGMRAAMMRRLELEADLQAAVDKGEFVLYYQPLVQLGDRLPAGVEALVRWQHPTRGLVPPMEFIPAAERTGAIIPLGAWVLKEACRQMKEWHQDAPGLDLAVNVSGRQLKDAGLIETVRRALTESGLRPDRLVLEMTESVLMENVEETLRALRGLKDLGVRLSVDDFGTGYSSLSYLRQFPVDVLKIDRSFVNGLLNPQGEPIVDTIMQMGKALNLEVVAEGIEEEAQLRELTRLHCDLGQGFLFSRPISAAQMTAYLRRLRSEAA
jgi:diguanylate cyclase (GGDEF)-like protein/PAS domain S-box-containing protein